MYHWWNNIKGGKPKYSRQKPIPVPLHPSNIPNGYMWDHMQASIVTVQTA
jgi:hypothetical protein